MNQIHPKLNNPILHLSASSRTIREQIKIDGASMDNQPITTVSIIDRVAALSHTVARFRDRFDTDRRLPDEVNAALVRADLFRLAAPRSVGGAQLGLRQWVEVIEKAAELDASLAWVLTNATVVGRMSGQLAPEVNADWFTAPDCMIAGSTATLGKAQVVDGGFVVSGVWPFASGIHSARRVMGLCELIGCDDPYEKMICAFLPVERVDIRDDWHSLGLRASGSCTFEAKDIFVPKAHTTSFVAHRPMIDADPYHLPNLSIFPYSVTLVALGITKAAITEFAALTDRTRGGTSAKLAERELIQNELGRAITLRCAARALVLDALATLEAAFGDPSAERTMPRALFRASLAQAGDLCETSMSIMCRALGTAAILESAPFERLQRDLLTATRHVAMGPHNLTVLGRVHLGLDPGTLRF